MLGDAILPIAVDEFLPDDFAWPSATELQLAERGVAFRDGTSAAKAYPEIWRTADAARKAIERERREEGDTNPNSVTFSYGKLPIGECHAVGVCVSLLAPLPLDRLPGGVGRPPNLRIGLRRAGPVTECNSALR